MYIGSSLGSDELPDLLPPVHSSASSTSAAISKIPTSSTSLSQDYSVPSPIFVLKRKSSISAEDLGCPLHKGAKVPSSSSESIGSQSEEHKVESSCSDSIASPIHSPLHQSTPKQEATSAESSCSPLHQSTPKEEATSSESSCSPLLKSAPKPKATSSESMSSPLQQSAPKPESKKISR